jgi:hypothetical protein
LLGDEFFLPGDGVGGLGLHATVPLPILQQAGKEFLLRLALI